MKSVISWKYIAGFFDGEGHIRVDHTLRSNGRRYTNPQMFISQSYPRHEVLYEIQSFLAQKGIPSRVKKRKVRERCADNYILIITSQQACFDFLHGIKKFSIVKQEEINEAVARIGNRLNVRSKPRWRSRFSEKDVEDMVDLYMQGISQAAIGRKYNTSQEHVSRLLRSYSGRLDIAV